MPVITKGTTVMDFFLINGPSAFNAADLNPAVVSASFPLVWSTPRIFSFLLTRLYVPSISASVPGSVKETLESLAIPSSAEKWPLQVREHSRRIYFLLVLGLTARAFVETV